MRSQMVKLVAVVLLLGVCVGCPADNPLNRQAVSGTVTYNGKPVPQGAITLVPLTNDQTISGASIVDGKFTIATEKGVAPGEYGIGLNIPDPDWTPALAKEPEDATPPEWVQGVHKVKVTEEGPNEFKLEVVNDNPPKYGN